MSVRFTVPRGYWTDAEDFSSDDWCWEVMQGATTLGYWPWVAAQRAARFAE